MKKTVFQYDSSDDEQVSPQVNATLDSNGDLKLYKIGNQVLSHLEVSTKYRQLKSDAGYQSDQYAKSVLQYLTTNSYTKDIINSAQNELLESLSKMSSTEYSDLHDKINCIRALYIKLEELQKKFKTINGKIDTEDFLCFKKLDAYYKYPNNQWAKYGIFSTFNINKTQQEAFLIEVQRIKTEVQATLGTLWSILENYPIIESKIFVDIDSISNLDDAKPCIKNAELNNKIQDIAKIKIFYQELENIQKEFKTANGKIDTEDFLCFKKLIAYYNNSQSEWAKKELLNVFGISQDKLQSFLEKIHNISEFQSNIQEFLPPILEINTPIYTNRLKDIIINDHKSLNLNFLIDAENHNRLEFKPLAHLDHHIEQTRKVDLFNSSEKQNINASFFLANSLFYQKLLKTTAKATRLMQFSKQVDGEYPVYINTSQFIKISHEFTTKLCRKDKIVSLGTYADVAQQLITVRDQLKKTDAELIDLFKDILKGANLFNIQKHSDHLAVKVLYDITYLLFSCETNRNPSALITNPMFLELVAAGECEIISIANIMPMAISGAIDVGRYYHQQYELETGGKAKKNDYGTSINKTSDISDFRAKENALIKQYREHYNIKTEDVFKEVLQKLIKNWYGLGVNLKALTDLLSSDDLEHINKLINNFISMELCSNNDSTLEEKLISIKRALLSKYDFLKVPDISKLALSCFDVIEPEINYNLKYLMKYIPVDISSIKYPTYVQSCWGNILARHKELYESRWKLVNFNDASLAKANLEETESAIETGEGISHNLKDCHYSFPYHKSFNQYYYTNIVEILKLRLKDLNLGAEVKVLSGKYKLSKDNAHVNQLNVDQMLEEVTTLKLEDQDIISIPYNIENKHWVGLVITKNNNILQINYLDSENKAIPENFLLALESKNKELEYDIKISQVIVEQQKFNNCGPETIENMILLLSGDRINPQEDVVPFHSQLIEDDLLGLSSYDSGHSG